MNLKKIALTTILLGRCSNNTTYLIKESCEEIAKIVQEPKIEKDISYIVKEQASKYNINGNIFFEYLVDDEGFIKVKNFLEEKIEGYKNDVEKFKENISEILEKKNVGNKNCGIYALDIEITKLRNQPIKLDKNNLIAEK